MPREASEPYVRAIARTLARTDHPMWWFENYPTVIYRRIKEIRDETTRPIQTKA